MERSWSGPKANVNVPRRAASVSFLTSVGDFEELRRTRKSPISGLTQRGSLSRGLRRPSFRKEQMPLESDNILVEWVDA